MVSVNKQLGDFLRQRREKMDPATLKLPQTNRRRTPGLRREEVAELAGISVDWYARLEQGRESLPSQGTVNALANALKLTASERAHLTKLAIGHSGRIFRRESVPENLKSLVTSLTTPAYVLGVRFDILFWNQASVDLFGDFGAIPVQERNSLIRMFGDPDIKKKYLNWESDARRLLENFRSVYDLWSHSPEFNDLVERLSTGNAHFKKWSNAHEVRQSTAGEKIMYHPVEGKSAGFTSSRYGILSAFTRFFLTTDVHLASQDAHAPFPHLQETLTQSAIPEPPPSGECRLL